MRVIVTAGPTREYIDTVRFLTNASSGKMGYACAAAAVAAGHQVTLISGPVALESPSGCRFVPVVSVDDLQRALRKHFPRCDALIMTAAVGDFTVRPRRRRKIPRAGGPVRITLVPTPDVLAGVARRRRRGQVLVAFAVEDIGGTSQVPCRPPSADMLSRPGDMAANSGRHATPPARLLARAEAKARRELAAKGCDYVVLNTPAAMAADASLACILAPGRTVLPLARRTKAALARQVIALLTV